MTETQSPPSSLKLIGIGKTFKEEFCDMIGATQMFSDFDWRDIETLSGYMQAYEASDGAALFREGDNGHYMCLIFKGRVDIYKEDHHDKKKIVAIVGAGKTLGEMAIIDGESRSATAIVSEPTTLAILTKENFLRITNEKPPLAAKILLKIARLLSQRLRRTSGLLVDYLED
ncbi:MAG: cyclic nucleotide-binding domain-containing protein [Betaproteobacteria bacterium]|nr:cyclic nucleotide-binding domain-containing protein [Betaproteobacteria bacterium]